MDDHHSVRVTIFGHEYTIRGEADPDYIRELANYVDEKMKEIERNTSLNLPLKVSILAAINLADEIFRLRATRNFKGATAAGGAEDGGEVLQVDREAVNSLFNRIEEVLKSP